MQLITLTTDFGTRDWFVGTMKGVILGLAPRATIVDLTHEIPAGDIRSGAFALAAGCRYFPKGTVHLAVVDPSVGSARPAIAVQTANYFFAGPDNGVLSFALARERIKAIHWLTNQEFFLKPVSRTFHGRDVFAPVAARLSRGTSIKKLGPRVKELLQLDWPQPHRTGADVRGEVIYVDRFGNAITNIPNDWLGDRAWDTFIRKRRTCSVERFYQSVRTGSPVAVPGSSGFLEIAVNGGSAEKSLGLKIGHRIQLRPIRGERQED